MLIVSAFLAAVAVAYVVVGVVHTYMVLWYMTENPKTASAADLAERDRQVAGLRAMYPGRSDLALAARMGFAFPKVWWGDLRAWLTR